MGVNYIYEILPRIDSMTADEIIQVVSGNEYIRLVELSQYPQFIQDIIFLLDLDTALAINGDVLMNSSSFMRVPHMITALKNIGANDDSVLLQRIYDSYVVALDYDEDRFEEVWNGVIDELYRKMYFYNDLGVDIWHLLELYVEREKVKV